VNVTGVCPPVSQTDRHHSEHPDRCQSDEDCEHGQLCCYFGDLNNHICRLTVEDNLVSGHDTYVYFYVLFFILAWSQRLKLSVKSLALGWRTFKTRLLYSQLFLSLCSPWTPSFIEGSYMTTKIQVMSQLPGWSSGLMDGKLILWSGLFSLLYPSSFRSWG